MKAYKEPKCCHDPNTEKTTLLFTKMMFMVYPPVCNCVCTVCGQSFKFIQKADGSYTKMSERTKKRLKTIKDEDDYLLDT